MQVEELCEAANKEVAAEDGVRIANFLCNGNYAVSGGLPGCEVGRHTFAQNVPLIPSCDGVANLWELGMGLG